MGGRVKLNTEIFINRAKEVHNSLYDYSKVVYQKSNIKVCVTDLEYGDFWITPNNHLRGRGHPTRGKIKTAKAQLLSKQEFIERAAAIHGDLYDYSKVEYINTKTKVKIIDPVFGVFEQSPGKHMSGQGNPLRARKEQVAKLMDTFLAARKAKSTTEVFVKRAREIHKELYDYSEVKYVNYHTKVKIIDPVYGVFEQTPASHLSGSGHRKRGIALTAKKKTKSKSEFIKKANLVHGGFYDYSKVEYMAAKKPVIIIDPEYGAFSQTPDSHLRGRGNPKRSREKIAVKLTSNTEEFITKASKIHGGLYDYSKVQYITARKPVIIIDPEYGEFSQTPDNHLHGAGHVLRGVASAKEKRLMNLAEFIKKATQIHGDIYDYSQVVLTGAHNKIIIIDPEFGPFQQTAASHLSGVGCPARAKYGFDPNIPAIVYYLRISGGKAYKIGITNRDVVSRYQKSDLDQIHIVKIWSYKVGREAKLHEDKLLEKFKNAKYSGPDLLSNGNSELFSFDVLKLDT